MKRFVTGLMKGRAIRWSALAVGMAVAGLSLAWDGHHYRVGGAWIGASQGGTWTALHSPLDAEGETAAIRTVNTSWGSSFAALLAAFGADTASDAVGEMRMISRDTAQWTLMAYAQKAGNPLEAKAIGVYSGTWKFTSQDTAVLNYSLNVYLPTADGYPDLNNPVIIPGVLPVTGLTDTAKRVPILK